MYSVHPISVAVSVATTTMRCFEGSAPRTTRSGKVASARERIGVDGFRSCGVVLDCYLS